MTQTSTFATRIGLSSDIREQMISLLNQQLANAFDLMSQTKQAHWNVKGPNFIALHKLFDDLADGLSETVDTIAERVTALGGTALGTVRMAAAASQVPEFPDELEGLSVVAALADRFAIVSNEARTAIDTAADAGDLATSDLFTEVVRDLDKHLYFLEAHLQG